MRSRPAPSGGVEDAKDPDVSVVKTREVPQDDVPAEYQDNDEHAA